MRVEECSKRRTGQGLGVQGRVQGSEEAQSCWSMEVKGMALGQREVAPPLKADKAPSGQNQE